VNRNRPASRIDGGTTARAGGRRRGEISTRQLVARDGRQLTGQPLKSISRRAHKPRQRAKDQFAKHLREHSVESINDLG
jgi:hypothetical protein